MHGVCTPVRRWRAGSGSDEQRKRQRQQRQMERETQAVERRGGERCALATVCAGKGGEEVRANDGWAPNSKSEEVCAVGVRTRGVEYSASK